MRITQYADLMAQYENPIEHSCDMRLGQTFIVENCAKPEGMCDSAWETLLPFVSEFSFAIGYLDSLMAILEDSDLASRERKIDLLKWNWLEENSFFNYFSIEKLFVFVEKLLMVERWSTLDKEKGQQLFRTLIGNLKSEVTVPTE